MMTKKDFKDEKVYFSSNSHRGEPSLWHIIYNYYFRYFETNDALKHTEEYIKQLIEFDENKLG